MTDASDPEPANAEAGVTMSLTVWTGHRESGWRACVVLADASRLDFASPFELARYIARPPSTPSGGGRDGLR